MDLIRIVKSTVNQKSLLPTIEKALTLAWFTLFLVCTFDNFFILWGTVCLLLLFHALNKSCWKRTIEILLWRVLNMTTQTRKMYLFFARFVFCKLRCYFRRMYAKEEHGNTRKIYVIYMFYRCSSHNGMPQSTKSSGSYWRY